MGNKTLLMKEIRDARPIIAGRTEATKLNSEFYNDFVCLNTALRILSSVGEKLNDVDPRDIPILATSALESLVESNV